ncbi:hypothetical protein OSG_eHP27_00140 [environmental Halophage eHP-27]|nr:hypothetical protein OSG_eHP27_00140 [environmental Halophage eHP-27]
MSQSNLKPEGNDEWTVADMNNENAKHFANRGEADDALARAKDAPGVDAELFPPGESPLWMYEDGAEPCESEFESDGGLSPGRDGEVVDATPVEPAEEMDDLPERTVADDPLTWMPGHFVDTIDGTQSINRKGFEVLAHFYDIGVASDLEVAPEDTDYTYCRVKATATLPDGRACESYGSAHVDRGDDATLLLEMADTRARKRALSIASGAGAVAVEELKNEVDR